MALFGANLPYGRIVPLAVGTANRARLRRFETGLRLRPVRGYTMRRDLIGGEDRRSYRAVVSAERPG